VTGPENVLLDRAQLERAFTALGDRLIRRGVVDDVFIVGGAAMALAYDATRVTRDVDSLLVPHGVVLEEARNVARELGLPMWWLNEQASVCPPVGIGRVMPGVCQAIAAARASVTSCRRVLSHCACASGRRSGRPASTRLARICRPRPRMNISITTASSAASGRTDA